MTKHRDSLHQISFITYLFQCLFTISCNVYCNSVYITCLFDVEVEECLLQLLFEELFCHVMGNMLIAPSIFVVTEQSI